MAHGLPDGALSGRSITVFNMSDIGELAARLGSIDTFNREGNVIFLDDFRHTLTAWVVSGSGEETDVWPVVYPSMRGGIAIMLKTGAAEDEVGSITHLLHYPAGSGMGIEAGFVPETTLKYLILKLLLFDGDEVIRLTGRYNHIDGTIEVRTGSTTWSHVATVGVQREGYGCFVSMKVVGNVVTKRYTRIIFNGAEYDASAHVIFSEDDPETRSMAVNLQATAGALGSAEIAVDDVIVTQNEPA